MWYNSPLPVRTDPEFGMHFILGYHLARQNVAHEQVVVHGLCDNFRHRGRVELDERIVFRTTGLKE